MSETLTQPHYFTCAAIDGVLDHPGLSAFVDELIAHGVGGPSPDGLPCSRWHSGDFTWTADPKGGRPA